MQLTFIGGGNMAAALAGGLVARGFDATRIKVVEILHEARTPEFKLVADILKEL